MNTLVLVLAFAILAFLLYKLWKPVLSPPKRSIPQTEARLYFFYTDWCGFSQKAQPQWKAVEAHLSRASYYGTTHVTPVAVNCESDKGMCELYGVEAYPTFKLETSSGIYEFKKSATAENIIGFLRQTLGKESASL